MASKVDSPLHSRYAWPLCTFSTVARMPCSQESLWHMKWSLVHLGCFSIPKEQGYYTHFPGALEDSGHGNWKVGYAYLVYTPVMLCFSLRCLEPLMKCFCPRWKFSFNLNNSWVKTLCVWLISSLGQPTSFFVKLQRIFLSIELNILAHLRLWRVDGLLTISTYFFLLFSFPLSPLSFPHSTSSHIGSL